jgi:predicted dehydrogenase
MKFMIVGLGVWGQTWAKLLEAHPQVQIVGAVDPSAAAWAWASQHLGMACHADLSEALRNIEADAVLIANPPAHHKTAVVQALSSGRHVLVEKPLVITRDAAAEVREAVEKSSAKLMVAQGYRFVDGAKRVRELVTTGQIGDLRNVRVTFRKNLTDFLPVQHSIYSWRHALVIDMGVHHFDLIRFITGQEVTHVYASEHETPDNVFAYPSNALCVIRLQGDVSAVWDADWCSSQPPTPWEGNWELVGSEARLFWQGECAAPSETSIFIQHPGKAPAKLPFQELVTDRREPVLEHFLDAVSRGRQPEPSVGDNLKTLDVALSCVESLMTKAEVRLAPCQADPDVL